MKEMKEMKENPDVNRAKAPTQVKKTRRNTVTSTQAMPLADASLQADRALEEATSAMAAARIQRPGFAKASASTRVKVSRSASVSSGVAVRVGAGAVSLPRWKA